MTKKVFREILSWVFVIVIAVALALVFNKLVFYKVSPPTSSMENTIMVGDKAFIFKLAYLFSGPKRGDIVVFEAPDNPEEDDYIKRVIGLPGDTVVINDGKVIINGEVLKEDYLKEPMDTKDYGTFVVPAGHYFMLGDNRNVSFDARFWDNKYIARNKIRGKAIFKYPDFKWLF